MATTFIFLTLFAACFAQNTIIDVLTARRETTLLDLIQAAGLTETLKTGGPFTLFAPTETAFRLHVKSSDLEALKQNPTQLAEILKYHLVSGKYMRTDLMVNEKMLDSVEGEPIRVNYYLYNRHVAVEGARILTFDQLASNGVVHLVDNVLNPVNGTIMDIISNDPNFSTLKAALEATGLDAALQDGPYTLLAPNNAAFQKLGDDLVQKLLGNPELLKSILLYHVTHGTLYSTGMHSGSLPNLEEVDRERIYAAFSGRTIHVDSANVIKKDVSATNGVMHVIDHVLVPASLAAQVKAL